MSFFCVFFAAIVFFLTQSIGGLGALILAVGVVSFFTKNINKKTRSALCIMGVVALVVVFLRIYRGADFVKPLFSLGKRLSYWKETLAIIKTHPFKGVGIGNFSLPETRHAHNSYLQLWAEAGIVGIGGWLLIVFLFLKNLISRRKTPQDFFTLGVMASGAAFLIHNLIDFSFFVPQAAFLWWIILGLSEQKTIQR